MKDFHVSRGAHWIVMSLFLTVAGCRVDSGISTDISTGTGTDTDTDSGNGDTGVRTTSVTVGQSGNVFTPRDIIVSAGATVTWTWAAVIPHNVTFDPSVSAPSLDRTTGTFEVSMPDVRGVYGYFCTIHGAAMSGSVAVE